MKETASAVLTAEQNVLIVGALLVLVLPLLAGLVLLLVGKKLPRQGDWLALGATGMALGMALYLFGQVWEKAVVQAIYPWFSFPRTGTPFSFTVGLYLDNLAVLMLVLVTFISFLVQVFSVVYMHHDRRYHLYFGFLGLFTFSMLGIVLAENLLLLFIFWELVGFSSYLLIGFWYEKDAAGLAGKKAFLFNRVGDIGFLLGVFLLYTYFGTFSLTALRSAFAGSLYQNGAFVFPAATGLLGSVEVNYALLTLAGLGLFCGCVGKSAQFPLQVWLPDAMEGPTPVSSLIHAATMVAAGVYLLARCLPFFTEDVLFIIAVIGGVTALLGALAATAQFDIKKVLAFSTISQLGYMVMGMGVGAPDAALLHLVTHAFFKASLFLNAGIIIHAMHHAAQQFSDEHSDVQDIRNMGGLRKILPVTFYTYLPAAAALIGLPLFSGFLSKDAILTGAWAWANLKSSNGNPLYYLIPVLGFGSVFLTGYYMARHFFFIFMGSARLYREPELLRESRKSEASLYLLVPVIILSVLSLAFFFSFNPLNYAASWLLPGISWQPLFKGEAGLAENLINELAVNLPHVAQIPILTAILSVVLAVAGIGLGWRVYTKTIFRFSGQNSTGTAAPATGFAKLALNHFYFDNLYNIIFIRPFLRLSGGVAAFDRNFIDYSLNTFGKAMVILAKIIGWFDREVVDGVVHLIVWLSGIVGKIGGLLQNGKVQSYYIYSLLGLVLLVLYILAW